MIIQKQFFYETYINCHKNLHQGRFPLLMTKAVSQKSQLYTILQNMLFKQPLEKTDIHDSTFYGWKD